MYCSHASANSPCSKKEKLHCRYKARGKQSGQLGNQLNERGNQRDQIREDPRQINEENRSMWKTDQ